MPYDPNRHHRHSTRLDGYDYSTPGAYSITVVAQNRTCLFGEVVDGEMRLNDAGRMIESVWREIPDHYIGVAIDAFVVMPNHFHGIVLLLDIATPAVDFATADVGAGPRARPPDVPDVSDAGRARGPAPTSAVSNLPDESESPIERLSVPDLIGRFKSLTTHLYIAGVKEDRFPPFDTRLWQRNYHDRIVRHAVDDIASARAYVATNPARWADDEHYAADVR